MSIPYNYDGFQLGTYQQGENREFKTPQSLSIFQQIEAHRTYHQKRWEDAANDFSFWKNVYGGSQHETSASPLNRNRFSAGTLSHIIGYLLGYQIDNRKIYQLKPRHNLFARACDQQNNVQHQLITESNLLDKFSTAFEGAITTGFSVIEPIPEWDGASFSYSLKVWETWNTTFDVNGRERDGSDWSYFTTTEKLFAKTVEEMYPDIPKDIIYRGSTLGAFQSYGSDLSYNPTSASSSYSARICSLLRIFSRERIIEKFFFNDRTQTYIPASREDLISGEGWRLISKSLLGWKITFFVNNCMVSEVISPFGEVPPFVPVFWDYTPAAPIADQKVTSLIRRIKDTEYLFCWLLNIGLEALAGRPNAGTVFTQGGIDNEVVKNVTNVANIIKKKEEAQISFIDMARMPAENIQLLEMLRMWTKQNAPIEFVEPDVNKNDSGLKTALTQATQLKGVAYYMSKMDLCLRNMGRLMCLGTLHYMPVAQAEIMAGEELDPYFWNISGRGVDFTVALGMNTDTQQQTEFAQAMEMFTTWGRQPSTAVMKLICPLANKEKIFALLEQEDEAAGKRMQEERNVAMQQQQAATEKTKADAILALHRTKEVDSRAADVLGLADEHTARAESAKATTVRTLAEAYRIMAEMDGIGLNSDKAKKEVEALREDINTEQKEIPLGEVGTPLLNELEREGEDYGQIEATEHQRAYQ